MRQCGLIARNCDNAKGMSSIHTHGAQHEHSSPGLWGAKLCTATIFLSFFYFPVSWELLGWAAALITRMINILSTITAIPSSLLEIFHCTTGNGRKKWTGYIFLSSIFFLFFSVFFYKFCFTVWKPKQMDCNSRPFNYHQFYSAKHIVATWSSWCAIWWLVSNLLCWWKIGLM